MAKEIDTPAICPACGSANIEYGSMEHQTGSVYYPMTCLDCGAQAREFYDLNYTGTVLVEGIAVCANPDCDGDPQTNQYEVCKGDPDCPGYKG